MSNGAATLPLTVDGTDVQQDPIGIFLELVHGLNEGPSVRGEDDTVPSLEGRTPLNRVGDTWRLEVRGWIAGVGPTGALQRASYRTLASQVRTMFDPRRQPISVAVVLEDGSVASIMARPQPTPLWTEHVPGFLAEVSFELEAVEEWDFEASS
jgi:hypothetical protein